MGPFCNKYIFLLFTNSSLFHYWWIARGDEFHVLPSDFAGFGIANIEFIVQNSEQVFSLVDELMREYKKNAKRSHGNAGGKSYLLMFFFQERAFPPFTRLMISLLKPMDLMKSVTCF